MGVALVPYVLAGLVSCALLSIIGVRFATDGFDALAGGRGELLPAIAFLMVLAVGTILAAGSFGRQVLATRRLTHRVHTLAAPVPIPLADAARETGLGGRIDYVEVAQPFSFAYGLLRPRVAVSRGLVDSTSAEEIGAVLSHERCHVRNLDPLKVVVARVVSVAYFFLPALRGLRRRYGAASELAADRHAMRRAGRPALAGALYQVVRGPEWPELATAAAMGGPELLDVRVAQLETGHEPTVAPVSPAAVAVTIAVLLLLATMLLVAIVSVGGPWELMRASMGGGRHPDDGMGMGIEMFGLWLLVPMAAAALVLARRDRSHTGRP